MEKGRNILNNVPENLLCHPIRLFNTIRRNTHNNIKYKVKLFWIGKGMK